MKRILDIESFLSEAENRFLQEPSTKIKHKKNSHPLTLWIKDSLTQLVESSSNDVDKNINLRTNKKLSKREVYTLKKASLDYISNSFFKKSNKDFFSNNFVTKLTSDNIPESFPIKIKKTQIIYIYFNIMPLSLIKLSKNSQILDPISGQTYSVEEYYQNSLRLKYIAPVDSSCFSLEYPLFFGYIILNK